MLTNDKLLRGAKLTGKKVILSTGMSTEEEIDHAVSILEEPEGPGLLSPEMIPPTA